MYYFTLRETFEMTPRSILYSVKRKKAQRATIAHLRASMSQNILNTSKVSELFFSDGQGQLSLQYMVGSGRIMN